MSLECGMEHINDRFDWQQSKGKERRKPSIKSGAQILINHDHSMVPELVKERFIAIADHLAGKEKSMIKIMPPSEVAVILRGDIYRAERKRKNSEISEIAPPKSPVLEKPPISTKTEEVSNPRALVLSL